DRHARGVADHRAELGLADRLRRHRHEVVAVGDVGAHEDDPGVGRRGADRDLGVGSGVHADAGEQRGRLDGVLEGAALETVCWHAWDLPYWGEAPRTEERPPLPLSKLVRRSKTIPV